MSRSSLLLYCDRIEICCIVCPLKLHLTAFSTAGIWARLAYAVFTGGQSMKGRMYADLSAFVFCMLLDSMMI